MTASQIKHRVVAITIALALTVTINNAISYAANDNSDATKVTNLDRSGGSQMPDMPRPRSGGSQMPDMPRP